MLPSTRATKPLVLALALACSGGGDGGGEAKPPPSPSISVDPLDVIVYPGQPAVTFTATTVAVAGPVSWSIWPSYYGSLSASEGTTVTWTPPDSTLGDRDLTVTATTAATTGTLYARATIHLKEPRLVVTPTTTYLHAGDPPVTLTATLEGTTGDVDHWWLSQPIGTLSATSGASVTYTPPATRSLPASITITASRSQPTFLAGAATVTVWPPPRLTVSPRSASVVAGGAPVALEADLEFSFDPITWTVSPGIGTLSSNGAQASWTPPASVPQTTPVTITAHAAGVDAAATVVVAGPEGITVDGRVLESSGLPMPGATVTLGGSVVTTGADGRFVFANVAPPYDVLVLRSSGQRALYVGLTRVDPVLRGGGTLRGTATITGTVTGFSLTGSTVKVCYCQSGHCDSQSVSAASPTFSLTAYAYAPGADAPGATLTGRLLAIEYIWNSTLSRPGSWGHYAELPGFTVPVGGTAVQDLALQDGILRTASMKAEVWAQTDWSAAVFLDYVLPEGSFYLYSDTTNTGLESYAFPLLPEGSVDVEGFSANWGPETWDTLHGVMEWTSTIMLPRTPATLVAPDDGASNLAAASVFSWLPRSGHISIVELKRTSQQWYEPIDAVVVSADWAAVAPMILAAYPGGTSWKWDVAQYGPARSVDDYASGDVPYYETRSRTETRTFTTAP